METISVQVAFGKKNGRYAMDAGLLMIQKSLTVLTAIVRDVQKQKLGFALDAKAGLRSITC